MLDLFSETEERKVCSFLKISSIVFYPSPYLHFKCLIWERQTDSQHAPSTNIYELSHSKKELN